MQLIEQKETASASYHSEQPLVRNINSKVYDLVLKHGKLTRNDIKRHTYFTARQISCAIWHLIKQGKLKTVGEKEDSITKHTVQVLSINDTPEILFKKLSNAEKLKLIKEYCEYRKDYSGQARDILEIINKK